MKKLKIMHLVEAFGGGIFTFLIDLVNSTCEEFDIVIAYSKRSETPDNFKEYFNENVRFIEIKNFERKIGYKDIKACFEIKKIIKYENPDIIHMHSSKAGIIGRIVSNSKKSNLVFTPHGYAFFKQDDSKIKQFEYKAIEKIIGSYKKSCTTVACSEGEYIEAKKVTKNAICINNGINMQSIDNEKINIKINSENSDRLRVCAVGRIDFQKNPRLFNEIAEGLPNVEFTWIGDGKQRALLTSDNIKVTGWMNREGVIRNIMENDVFLLTSLWEGLPISLLEAMYLKKICIVSNVIGNKNVIKNMENGIICDTASDFIESIESVEKNEVNREKLTDNAVNSIKREYNINVMSKKYSNLYKSFYIKKEHI